MIATFSRTDMYQHRLSDCGRFFICTLNLGCETRVDADEFPKIELFNWRGHQRGGTTYVRAACIDPITGKSGSILLHRLIMNAPPGLRVDHINGNGLDNTKANLRLCTAQQNGRNSGKWAATSSSFKGVSIVRGQGRKQIKWRATIRVADKKVHLGCFDTEVEAAQAYDVAALEHFGEFARTNGISQ